MIVGYKEWSLVCEALGSGRQTILLRKGGTAEGKSGFAFKHQRFCLLPTLFHQQEDRVNWRPRFEKVRDESSSWIIRYEAEIIESRVLTDRVALEALQSFHIWKEEVVHERFEYQGQNLIHAALVRVKRLHHPLIWAESKELSGCRSWVEYPVEEEFPGSASIPVLSDDEFEQVKQKIGSIFSK